MIKYIRIRLAFDNLKSKNKKYKFRHYSGIKLYSEAAIPNKNPASNFTG